MNTSRRMTWRVLALVVVLVALGLRLYRVEAQSLWYDEGITAGLATRTMATIARNAADDIHPPLYYWLLSWWENVVGDGVFALRAFSAFAGTVLVAGVLALGRRLLGLAAALAAGALVALSPYLVWYSQEVRMYALAAAWGAALVWLTLELLPAPKSCTGRGSGARSEPRAWTWLAYALVAAAALYTHYFAGVSALAVANAVAALGLLQVAFRGVRDDSAESSDATHAAPRPDSGSSAKRDAALGFAWRWMAVHIAAAAMFVPWLVRAWPTIRDWPALGESSTVRALAVESLRTFALGVEVPEALAAGYGAAALLAACGLVAGLWKGRRWGTVMALVWLATPVFLMWLQSLVRPAWNPKFLIVAAPGFELLVGAGAVAVGSAVAWLVSRLANEPTARAVGVAATVGLVLAAAWPRGEALRANYFDPAFQRDDYQGIVRDIAAMADPGDVIVVNAPTQVEMIGYYDRGRHEVVPLPVGRPADGAATLAELTRLGDTYRDVYAVLWATEQADPDGLVEGWLNENRAKAFDRWYGDVRLALWAAPREVHQWLLTEMSVERPVVFGDDEIALTAVIADSGMVVAPGDVLTLEAWWTPADEVGDGAGVEGAPPRGDYVVFLHLVDDSGALVAQRDMAPRNGMEQTSSWVPSGDWATDIGWWPDGTTEIMTREGFAVRDRIALAVPAGLTEGTYRLLIGLYDPATGARLPVRSMREDSDRPGGEGLDHLDLGRVTLAEDPTP